MRRSYFTLLLFVISLSSAFAKDNPYSMFRGNAQHSGIYPQTEVRSNPTLKWRFKTEGFINSSAAIEGDNLFFGSGDGYLYSVNSNDGSQNWKFQTGGEVHSSPAVVDGIVYFGSHDGNFYALNANDGSVKWTFKTEGEKRFSAYGIHGNLPKDSLFVDPWDFWLSSPVVNETSIYFGSGDGYFYALNKKDGSEKWKFKTGAVNHSSPALAFGNVYFGSWDTYMHALSAETGTEVWKFQTGIDTDIYNQTGITSSPVVNGDILYFGCRDANIYAVNAHSGDLVWKKFNNRGWISVTPVVYDEKVIYASGSSRSFVALNKMNGDSVYKFKTAAFFSSPAVVGTTLYYGDFNGFIEAMDINTGKVKWSYQIPTSIEDPLHFLNADKSFNQDAFQKYLEKYEGDKSVLQLRFSLGAMLSSPVVKDGSVYIGSTDGYFYALK